MFPTVQKVVDPDPSELILDDLGGADVDFASSVPSPPGGCHQGGLHGQGQGRLCVLQAHQEGGQVTGVEEILAGAALASGHPQHSQQASHLHLLHLALPLVELLEWPLRSFFESFDLQIFLQNCVANGPTDFYQQKIYTLNS